MIAACVGPRDILTKLVHKVAAGNDCAERDACAVLGCVQLSNGLVVPANLGTCIA